MRTIFVAASWKQNFEVAKAKGNLREIKLYAQVGFTGTDNEFNSAYRRLKDNQIVEVGFKISYS